MKPQIVARHPIVEHAHKLTLEVYRLTERILENDPDSLAGDLRRAALTVTSKLAAHHSGLPPDITEFRDAATSSAFEVEALLVGAIDCGHISEADGERLRCEY